MKQQVGVVQYKLGLKFIIEKCEMYLETCIN